MARIFTCGFELGELIGYNGSYNENISGGSPVVSSPVRTGNYSWENNAGDANAYGAAYSFFTQELSDLAELYVRIGLRHAGLKVSATYKIALVGFYDGGTNQVTLGIDPVDGRLILLQGGSGEMGYNGTQLAKGTINLTQDTWYAIEIYVKAAATGGQVIVKVNNVTDISYSGNLAPSGNDRVNQVQIGVSTKYRSTEDAIYFDDIAINDTTGSYQNSWPGTGGTVLLVPTSDGASLDWTPSTGTDHYATVDEIPANDTDWNQAQTSGSKDLYGLSALPPEVAAVDFVQVLFRAALSDPGFNQLVDVIRDGGVDYDGATENITTAAPNYILGQGAIWYTRPGGTTPWGTADVNAIQAGVKIP